MPNEFLMVGYYLKTYLRYVNVLLRFLKSETGVLLRTKNFSSPRTAFSPALQYQFADRSAKTEEVPVFF